MFVVDRRLQSVLSVVLGIICSVSLAQPGPDLSCENCPEFQRPPFPETGVWYNPDQSGVGFTLEVQDGRVGGFYFGYDEEGAPAWFLVAGDLETIESPVRGWGLTASLESVSGGPCINCPWQPFAVNEPGGEVEFVFEQRAFGRYRIDEGDWQNIQPLVFGAMLAPLLEEQTPYLFPTLEGFWSITIERPSKYVSIAVRMTDLFHDEEESGVIRAQIFSAEKQSVALSPPAVIVGELYCGPHPDAASPMCVVELDEFDTIFHMPVTALTDSYFRAEVPEHPRVLEAHRLNYD